MITNTDDRSLARLDPRIREVIMRGETGSDRQALFVVVKLAAKTRGEKRAAIFDHFERTISQRVRYLVPELRRVFDEVATVADRQVDYDMRAELIEAERAGRTAIFADGERSGRS